MSPRRGGGGAMRARMPYQAWPVAHLPARRHPGASRRKPRPVLCVECILWLALSGILGLLLHHALSQAFGTVLNRMPFS